MAGRGWKGEIEGRIKKGKIKKERLKEDKDERG